MTSLGFYLPCFRCTTSIRTTSRARFISTIGPGYSSFPISHVFQGRQCQVRTFSHLTPSVTSRQTIADQPLPSHPQATWHHNSQTARPLSNMPSNSPSGVAATDGAEAKKKRPAPAAVRPSSSILLLSPTNQVLLLHRVRTSTSFASAHVFPGGNLSAFHEGNLPALDSEALHEDSETYRLAAIREAFEESGILLARQKDGSLLDLSDEAREAGRKAIHGNKTRFTNWLASVGGVPDTAGLIPFTRWITPPNAASGKRFTTQMYLYMLPLSAQTGAPGAPKKEVIIPTPTHDGGLEHTAATFDDPSAWISRARSGEIILFPPQIFLLHIVSQFVKERKDDSSQALTANQYQSERDALLGFVRTTPTVPPPGRQVKRHPTASIPWAKKVMSPTMLLIRKSDQRLAMGLEKPGPELKGTGKGGDWDRVVLVHFKKEGPRNVEIRWREDVLREERELEKKEETEAAKL